MSHSFGFPRFFFLFFFFPDWPFPVGHPRGRLSLQGPAFASEDVFLQPSFIFLHSAEAETSIRAAPRHPGRGWPSPGRPEALSLRASGGEPRGGGGGGRLGPSENLLRQRNRKHWAQEGELEPQASEDGKNSRSSEGPTDVCGRYVTEHPEDVRTDSDLTCRGFKA